MNMQQTETMLNLTRFERIKLCINIHFEIIHLKTMSCLVTKLKTRINYPLFNIYEHYYSAACNNVTEDNKMNETKNNERQ